LNTAIGGFDQAVGNEGIDHFRQRQAVILDVRLIHGMVRCSAGMKSRRWRYGEL
jgi:hypothetical protein